MSQPDSPDTDERVLAVVSLLSAQAAAYLRSVPYERARIVVKHLVTLIECWEASNVALDPVQREVIFDSIVYTLCALYAEFEGAIGDLATALYRPIGPFGE